MNKYGAIALVALFLASCLWGIIHWQDIFRKADAPQSPEQIYYQQMAFVVNEMHNQILNYDTSQGKETLSREQIDEGKRYVDTLMNPLQSPPEKLIVAQYITERIYHSYQDYVSGLEAGAVELQTAAFQDSEDNYDLFTQNAILMKTLGAYKGVDIYCH